MCISTPLFVSLCLGALLQYMGQIFDHLGSLILVILTFTDQDNKHITVFLRVFFFISLISMNYITPISPIIFLIYPP